MLEFQSTFPNSKDTHIFFPPLCSLPFPTSHIMPPKEIPWAETLRHLSTPHRCYHKRFLEKVMIWLNSSSKFDKTPQSPLVFDRNPFLQVARPDGLQDLGKLLWIVKIACAGLAADAASERERELNTSYLTFRPTAAAGSSSILQKARETPSRKRKSPFKNQ